MLACVLLEAPDDALLRRLLSITPVLEQQGQLVLLDVSGTSRLHGGARGLFAAIRQALAPQVPRGLSLASNRFTAEVAARHGRGKPLVVAPGDEASFLAHLPLGVLPLSDELHRRLQPLGLERVGDLASLPVASLEARYGPEGVVAHRLARGEDEAGLVPACADEPLQIHVALEEALTTLTALREPLSRAVDRLGNALFERDRGVTRLVLRLVLDPARDVEADEVFGAAGSRLVDDGGSGDASGSLADRGPAPSRERPAVASAEALRIDEWGLVPAAPENRAGLLLDLLEQRLAERAPGGAVIGLALQACELEPLAVHQNRLFGEVARDASRRREAITRLGSVLGARAVAEPVPWPEHRPERRWRVAEEPPSGGGSWGARAASAAPGGPGDVRVAPNAASPQVARVDAPAGGYAKAGAALGTTAGTTAKSAGSGRRGKARSKARRRRQPEQPERARPAARGERPVLRLLPQPEELVPIQSSGSLLGFRHGRRTLGLVRLSAARRLEGGWWSSEPWARDEFDLHTQEGAVLRICRDMVSRRWLLLGELD